MVSRTRTIPISLGIRNWGVVWVGLYGAQGGPMSLGVPGKNSLDMQARISEPSRAAMFKVL